MHGRISIWLTCGLAIAFVGPGVARAQYQQSTGPETYPAIAQLTQGQTGGQLVSAESYSFDDMAKRMEAVEKAIKDAAADKKKADEKAAAEKKKAASQPSYKLRGRTYVDTTMFSQDAANAAAYPGVKNGIGFRSARLGIEGEMFNVFSYCTEIDFVSGIFDNDGTKPLLGDGVLFKEVWMGVSELPVVQNARVGNFKEPFMLEELTSSRFITFMERSMINQAVCPAYNLGGMIFGQSENKNLLWQTGLFQNDIADTFVSRTADDLAGAWTSRVVWLPWYDECTDGRGLLHFGAAYSYRDARSTSRNFRAQPSARFGAPYVIAAGSPALSDYQLYGLESAWVYGPLSIQSEYINATLDPTAAGTVDQNIWGYYFMVSYFLTGENRGYKRDVGRFDRVKPYENFFRVRAEDNCIYTGKGAWELAYRFDYCDATDVSLVSGLAANHTFGVNWYLSPYNRIMWDYIHCDPQKNGADAGTLDALSMRFQVDF